MSVSSTALTERGAGLIYGSHLLLSGYRAGSSTSGFTSTFFIARSVISEKSRGMKYSKFPSYFIKVNTIGYIFQQLRGSYNADGEGCTRCSSGVLITKDFVDRLGSESFSVILIESLSMEFVMMVMEINPSSDSI
ncbi:uncharacterized protein F5891DRAFT_1182227 [Suillus fuscotomentosus]|uniref:Uncharacterized protein n=1 Tax=Suillus fuscotomentosus TaxID=1912939 RepID=A0AAD4HRF6_9AGAM|nr:uncharacterized protein F5891DRAFT_1182227 [Suillus fuscotomentosus]KAG1906057.1 hypothetical protein F5891DRAFT_1182227 [Suillus fuscotomentosus]